jgi:hypothetical protein
MKRIPMAAALLAAIVLPAYAGPCDTDLRQIDNVLQSDTVQPDQRAQAEDMRQQAVDLCKAGNDQEAADVVSELKVILQIE